MAQPTKRHAQENERTDSVTANAGLAPGEPSALRRELGLLDAVGVGFGAVVGAGILP
jgi:hypothetical protein